MGLWSPLLIGVNQARALRILGSKNIQCSLWSKTCSPAWYFDNGAVQPLFYYHLYSLDGTQNKMYKYYKNNL